MLHDDTIRLRALEPADADKIYEWENISEYWRSSATLAPYSYRNIMRYIADYDTDPFHSGELRLVIEYCTDRRAVGLVDLYNVEVRHRRACVGILIEPAMQGRRLALRSLKLLERYCREHLQLHQLLVAIPADNVASLKLFTHAGYKRVATLPDYIASCKTGHYSDVEIMNIIL